MLQAINDLLLDGESIDGLHYITVAVRHVQAIKGQTETYYRNTILIVRQTTEIFYIHYQVDMITHDTAFDQLLVAVYNLQVHVLVMVATYPISISSLFVSYFI